MQTLSRRSVLRGLAIGAGASLFTPLVTDWMRQARGQLSSVRRIAFLFGRYSFPHKYMDPVVRNATDFDLNSFTAPLEPFKSETLLVRNLGAPHKPGANGGHGQDDGVYLGLGENFGWDGEWNTKVGKDGTIDRLIARRIGQNDQFSSLSFRKESLLPVDYLSWDGDDQPYPPFTSPLEAYDKIFGAAVPNPDAAPIDTRALLQQDRSLLDFVSAEVTVLEGRLAGAEREKLQRFTESLRAVEHKLAAVAAAPVVECTEPEKPATDLPHKQGVEIEVDIAAMALGCGLSHVSAINLGPDNHDENHEDAPSVGTDNTWRLEQAARTFAKLKEMGLGDSSLVLFSDSNGQDHHGGHDQSYFYWLLGGLGGKIKTGRVIDLPDTRPYLGDFYVAIANAMGLEDVSSFGSPEWSKGPLTEVLG